MISSPLSSTSCSRAQPVSRCSAAVRSSGSSSIRPSGRGGAVRSAGGVGPGGQPVADPGPRPVAVPDSGRRASGDDPTAADHRDLVGQVLRLVHVVGGQQHRLAQRRQVLDHLPGLMPGRRVESSRRFVQEQQVRVPGQGDRDVQPPLLAAGQLQYPAIALGRQAHEVDHLIHRARMRIKPRVHRDRLYHGQVTVHPGRLQDDPDLALQPLPLPPRVVSQDLDRAAVARPVALEDLDCSGFPGAVRAEKREDLPALHGEVDPADRLHVAVGLGQAAHLDRGAIMPSQPSHGTHAPAGSPPLTRAKRHCERHRNTGREPDAARAGTGHALTACHRMPSGFPVTRRSWVDGPHGMADLRAYDQAICAMPGKK